MEKTRFTETQIVSILKHQENGPASCFPFLLICVIISIYRHLLILIKNMFPMNRKVSTLAIVFAFFSNAVAAQEIKNDFKPSILNQPGQLYPQVNSQGYARFKIKAPTADSVKVSLGLGGSGGTILTKDADGFFTGITAGPMDEGFHYYHVLIDGGMFNDPGTLNFYGSARWASGIEIPAQDGDFYGMKDVPHGHVSQVLFPSKSTGTARRAFVYTPPGYEKDVKKHYPVFLHTSGL